MFRAMLLTTVVFFILVFLKSQCLSIPVQRFSRPLPENVKAFHDNDLPADPEKTATKTAQISADLPGDMQKIIASWDYLPDLVQAAMLKMADVRK